MSPPSTKPARCNASAREGGRSEEQLLFSRARPRFSSHLSRYSLLLAEMMHPPCVSCLALSSAPSLRRAKAKGTLERKRNPGGEATLERNHDFARQQSIPASLQTIEKLEQQSWRTSLRPQLKLNSFVSAVNREGRCARAAELTSLLLPFRSTLAAGPEPEEDPCSELEDDRWVRDNILRPLPLAGRPARGRQAMRARAHHSLPSLYGLSPSSPRHPHTL